MKAKPSPVTSHDDLVAHFAFSGCPISSQVLESSKNKTQAKRLINQEFLELFFQLNNLTYMKAGLNISLRKHRRNIKTSDHQAYGRWDVKTQNNFHLTYLICLKQAGHLLFVFFSILSEYFQYSICKMRKMCFRKTTSLIFKILLIMYLPSWQSRKEDNRTCTNHPRKGTNGNNFSQQFMTCKRLVKLGPEKTKKLCSMAFV